MDMLRGTKIAILGTGNIGGALLGGLLKASLAESKDITATCATEDHLAEISQRFGVRTTQDNRAAVETGDLVLLCVKPVTLPLVLEEIREVAAQRQRLYISVAAGIQIRSIEQRLGPQAAVIRAMPNIPALVDAAATAIAFGQHARDEHGALAEEVFGAVGTVCRVQESLMDAVTGLSGSGPAYIYMVIEALTDGGVKMGLSRQTALRLATQTVLGSAKLVQETGVHPAVLKDQVTTPGGTAIAAVHELESGGLRPMLINAVVTATRRSQELSQLGG
jgi:pyrroline-5-carboxylate reductase